MLLSSPDAFFQSSLARTTIELRDRLNAASLELVTGRVNDPAAAVRGLNGTILQAEAELASSEPERARLAILEGRYRTANSALAAIREIGAAAGETALGAAEDASGSEARRFAVVEAESALSSIFGSLGTQFSGRSLFSGDVGQGQVLQDAETYLADVATAIGGATDGATVSSAIRAFLGTGGGFETTTYTGGAPTNTIELESGQRLRSITTADDPSFRLLFEGLTMIALSDQVDVADRADFLRTAGSLVQQAEQDLIAEEAAMGLSLNAIDRERVRLDQRLFDANNSIDQILGRDPFEAASETQDLETRLQAAYTIAGRVGNLRLTNFLR